MVSQLAGLQWLTVLSMLIRGITITLTGDWHSGLLTEGKTRGGGGTSILKVSGTCRWQGYDFAIIAIKTGCLNQPNHWHRVSNSAYLATGMDYSDYHRVAFPPTMFMTGPRSRHRRDATRRCVRDQYSNDRFLHVLDRETFPGLCLPLTPHCVFVCVSACVS